MMPDYSTRNIIDYAMDDNGVEFRNALYDNIHAKVSAHFELAKQEMAKNMLAEPEEEISQESNFEETDQQ
jgi:hypothetical protein